MSATVNDRIRNLVRRADDMHRFYGQVGLKKPVTLFAQDFDFLKQRRLINTTDSGNWLKSRIPVVRGEHKPTPSRQS